jgi:hypothetical protein
MAEPDSEKGKKKLLFDEEFFKKTFLNLVLPEIFFKTEHLTFNSF